MKPSIKASLFVFAIFLIIFLIVWLIISSLFKDLSSPIVGAITAAIASVLSPQQQTIQKQTGKHIQLKWIFSKKVITIK